MSLASRLALVIVPLAVLAAGTPIHAAPKTVCTITVNSADEKDAFRRHLPPGEYRFVELLEPGRSDWLRSACRQGVQCDVLLVSGHFNAGDTFYSDKVSATDHLQVDELERASCSESCPGVFAHLKEVYLFGCESLNPDATRYASSYGESGRDRMRRLFANVPAIYGFYSSAPVGPTASMLLDRYFAAAPRAEIASGRPNRGLLAAFRNNHITLVSGLAPGDPGAAHRREVCTFYDERRSAEEQLAFVHRLLQRDRSQVREYFERIEKLVHSFGDLDRQAPTFARALAGISGDVAARDRYLALARDTARPEMRVRMIALARSLGWLDERSERAEQLRMVEELLARGSLGYAEVELVCSLNDARALDGDGSRLRVAAPASLANAAVLACLGNAEARARVLRALTAGDAADARVAQAYLRRRPLDATELRAMTREIARMDDPRAQARALETLALQNVSDRAILEELTRSFSTAKSVGVQRAIAEVFIRSDPRAIPRPELAIALREHRLGTPGSGDLVDVLIRRLAS
jgi:hypothetical protein